MGRSSHWGFRRPKVFKLSRRRRLPRVELLETRQLLSTFYVSNTYDHGTGSLRYAINQANVDPISNGADLIEPIGSIGPIILGKGLPEVTRADVTLEDLTIVGNGTGATSGTGSSNSGAPPLSTANGLSIGGGSDAVSGFGVTGFGGSGIYVSAGAVDISQSVVSGIGANGITLVSSGNLVVGNIVGLNAAGNAADANTDSGIVISGGADNTIGGTGAGQGNVVSGNDATGIALLGGSATGNLVEGNYVGTDATGTFAIGNVSDGILVFDGASSNTIGPGNVISGNQSAGLFIFDDGTATSDNLVVGNLIGTDKNGTVAIGNSDEGIYIGDGASSNTVGGAFTSDRNIISGNNGDGIQFGDTGTTLNVVEGNFIGTDFTGTVGLGNTGNGISIIDGASDETIGGVSSGIGELVVSRSPGNVIADNGENGIWMAQDGSSNAVPSNILIEGNFIGVDKTGSVALGNGFWGIIADNSASDSIGGTVSGAGNVISANNQGGLAIYGGDSTDDLVAGNLIGTDSTGSIALGNAYSGVYVGSGSEFSDNTPGSASYTTIGGTVAGAGNLISGNDTALTGNGGIVVDGSGASDNLIAGNQIGVVLGDTGALANQGIGVHIFGGATDNTVGGTTTVAGNTIADNTFDGVNLSGPLTSGNVVAGNTISDNGDDGVGVSSSSSSSTSGPTGNFIGGFSSAYGNDISGNKGAGIYVLGSAISGNLFAANTISGNAGDGVDIFANKVGGPTGNTVGGTSPADANTIVSNVDGGVDISGSGTSDNTVEGNFIGTNSSDATGLGNGLVGVTIFGGATDNTIGGVPISVDGFHSDSVSSYANTIVSNGAGGVDIENSGTTGNVVEGNYIGTDSGGDTGLGNIANGVEILDGASGNTIGGTIAGAGNVIAFNGDNGVQVGNSVHDAALENAILENSIFSNTDLGIDIDNSAPQAAPVLGVAFSSSTQTSISGTVTGADNTTLRVEFFSNPAGTAQGKTYLGFLNVTTNGSGMGSFTFTPASVVAVGLNITATATDPNGNTSEFSAPDNVQAAPVNVNADLSVTAGGFIYNRTTREFSQTLTIKNTSGAPIPGPIELELVNLKNATLVNSSGTYQGNPYITILSSGSLGIGQSLTFTLYFSDPTLAQISYTAEFLAGPIPPPPPPA